MKRETLALAVVYIIAIVLAAVDVFYWRPIP